MTACFIVNNFSSVFCIFESFIGFSKNYGVCKIAALIEANKNITIFVFDYLNNFNELYVEYLKEFNCFSFDYLISYISIFQLVLNFTSF